MGRDKKMTAVFCIAIVGSLAMTSMATIQDDEKECAGQLANLAACIPFVRGTAQKPTPECCQDTQKLKASKPKCLCVLIKESTDPSMGLPVNTTLALQMPSACNIDAKVSDCPTILGLAPDSPDAKIFKEAGSSDSSATTTTTSITDSPPSAAFPSFGSSSSSSSSSSPDSSSKSDSKGTSSGNNGAKAKQFGGGTATTTTAAVFAIWLMFI